ncbi:PQQ-binding-like beta-propeller repeat protein [Candidatus Nephthysia bennettiae]|uniref:outer membrane protein assembly factor BamB family protein n=1 Tax=Candidatus Nephthysia bennettiae TaxID=3127016 RepID=UPI001A224226|nr:PQQ-binding-like beta-propeller repeat protein [Candidatus Dormibacteraeota bacterium]
MKVSAGPLAHGSTVKPRPLAALALAVACFVFALLSSGTAAFAAAAPAGAGRAAPRAATGDWPSYLHDPARTAANPGENTLSAANASQLTRLWSFKTGGVVAASATVVGGVVFVGSWDGYEYAVNVQTGKKIWQTFLGITSTTHAGCSPSRAGVSSAAAVESDVVYVGGGDSWWYALDATDGRVLWKVFTGDNSPSGGHYNWSSPLVYNGSAYIGVASLGDCPLVQGQLLRVDLATHQVVASFDVVPKGQVGGGIWTSPSLDAATGTIFVTTGTESSFQQKYVLSLVALDAKSLAVKGSWQIPQSQAGADSDWGTTPVLVDDARGNHLVAAINKNGFAYAFQRDDVGAGPVWQRLIATGGICPTCGDGSVSSGATGAGRLYLGGGKTSIAGTSFKGGVRALNPATGSPVWERGTAEPVIAALAYANGLVMAGAGQTLEVLDAASGARLYNFATGSTIYGAPSVSGGRIFAGSVDGSLYAFGLASTPGCPGGWTCADVGSPVSPGGQSLSGGVWTVTGGGNDIWARSDQFHFVWQQLAHDGGVQARVVSQQNTSTWAKTGVMLRQTTDPGSPYYAAYVTPGNGIVVQYRATQGAVAVRATSMTGTAPAYLRVSDSGGAFTAYTSSDGGTWTPIPGSARTLSIPAPLLAGLAVTSHQGSTVSKSLFDQVAVG